MLYIFEVLESNYFKFGWTERPNAYDRIQNGFWTNIHPEELCQKGDPENNREKLSPNNLHLIFLFEGDSKLESVITSLFPLERGEVWRKEGHASTHDRASFTPCKTKVSEYCQS